MTKNFLELIKAKDYQGFTDVVSESLDENASVTFNEFREMIQEAHSRGHTNMVDDATDDMEVSNADGTKDTSGLVPAAIDAQLSTEDVDLTAVIGVLMDEGVLTEEDLDTVTEEELIELSKATLGSYVKKSKDSLSSSAYNAGKGREGKSEFGETKKVIKREKGIDRAVNRLTKEATEVKEAIVDDYVKKGSMDSTSNAVWNGVDHIAIGPDENDVFMSMLDKKEPGKTDKELGLSGKVVTGIVQRYRNKIAGTKDVE